MQHVKYNFLLRETSNSLTEMINGAIAKGDNSKTRLLHGLELGKSFTIVIDCKPVRILGTGNLSYRVGFILLQRIYLKIIHTFCWQVIKCTNHNYRYFHYHHHHPPPPQPPPPPLRHCLPCHLHHLPYLPPPPPPPLPPPHHQIRQQTSLQQHQPNIQQESRPRHQFTRTNVQNAI